MRPPSPLVALAAVVWGFAVDPSPAAGETGLTWRLAGGSCAPVHSGLFRDLHTSGINLGGGAGALLPAGLRLFGTYDFNSLFADEESAAEFVQSQDPSFDTSQTVDANPTRLHTVMGVAFLPLTGAGSARPYVIGGVGWMWVRAGDITYSAGQVGGGEESGFATALGGGVELRAGPALKVFVEAVWYVGFTPGDTTQIVPVRVGIYH